MSTSIYHACLFVDEKGGTPLKNPLVGILHPAGMSNAKEAYRFMKPMLLQYAARFEFECDILPFQLRYRFFHLYCCDTGGLDDAAQRRYMESLGKVVRGRLSRVFLFWTDETFNAFEKVNPDLRGHTTCINACSCDWMRRVVENLVELDD